MPYVDFNSLIINCHNIDYEKLKNIMQHFKSCGVRNFIITYDVDLNTQFLSSAIFDIKNIKNNLRRIKPFATKVHVAPSVLYHPDLAYDERLRRLTFNRTNKIFLRIPDHSDFSNDEFFRATNHLLYKRKYIPIFTRFENVLLSYPSSLAKKIFRTRKAAFCLDVNFLSGQFGTVSIFSAMNGDAGILLLPSISDARGFSDYASSELLFSDIKKRYDRNTYLKFCRYLNDSIKQIFPLK